MILFHASRDKIVKLTDAPMFLSATVEEARAWPDGTEAIYEVEVAAKPVAANEELSLILCANPLRHEITNSVSAPLTSFKDYDPRDFERDTIAYLCLDPSKWVIRFTLI